MIHKFFIFMMFFIGALGVNANAYAQQRDVCHIEYEVIFNLDVPRVGSYAIWDTAWGDRDEVEFFQRAVVREDANVFLVGKRAPKDLRPERLIFAQTRRHGRLKWHKEHALPGLTSVVQVLKRDEGGYIVLANIHEKNEKAGREFVWIGFMNEDGQVSAETTLEGKRGALQAHDLVKFSSGAKKNGRYLLAASAPIRDVGGAGDVRSSTVLYVLDGKGKALSKRSLVMGPGNRILSLERLEPTDNDPGGFLGTGYNYDVHGRKMGWIVRLNDEGAIVWQQQYPRGAGAQLVSGLPLRGDTFVVVGTASPLIRDGKRSAWAMAVARDDGAVIWQRYFTGEPEFFGRDLLVSEEGLVSVLIDGDVLEEDDAGQGQKKAEKKMMTDDVDPGVFATFDDLSGIGHVRLMTLNPRGSLLKGDAYYNDEDVNAYQLVSGVDNERIAIGGTDAIYQQELPVSDGLVGNEAAEGAGVMVVRSMDGWFASTVPAPSYEDPCLPKPYRVP